MISVLMEAPYLQGKRIGLEPCCKMERHYQRMGTLGLIDGYRKTLKELDNEKRARDTVQAIWKQELNQRVDKIGHL